ncbi:MAG: hypothetical protein QM790_10460 [Nibricoccus sp.]
MTKWYTKEWLPAWLQAGAALVALALSVISLYQSSAALRSTAESLYLSGDCTIDVQVRENALHISNPGRRVMHFVTITAVGYEIPLNEENPSPLRNNGVGAILAKETLAPGESFILSEDMLKKAETYRLSSSPKILRLRAIKIEYSRDIDSKRFIHIEPFLYDSPGFTSVLQRPNVATIGGFEKMIPLYQRIIQLEREIMPKAVPLAP